MPSFSISTAQSSADPSHIRHPKFPALHIFKRETGGWYAGFHQRGYYNRKAARTNHLPTALAISADWYMDQLAARRLGLSNRPAKHSVRDASAIALKRLEAAVERGERSKSYLASIKLLLNSDILPFFGDSDVAEIGMKKWSEYETNLLSRRLTRQTLHQHRNALRRCLNEAIRQEWIERLPSLKLDNIGKAQQTPRVWFEPDEFQRLLKCAQQHIRDLQGTRWAKDALECYDLIIWIANTGMRVGEARNAKVCDIEVHTEMASDDEARPYCLIKNIKGKRGTGDCRSWYDAYCAYQRIILRRELADPNKCAEPLFLCHHRDMFNAILEKANLKFTTGDPKKRRDLVSLRHTYIAFRLLQGVSVYDVARNCRTSVAMIENHYAKYISPRLLTGLNRFTPIQPVRKNGRDRSQKESALEHDHGTMDLVQEGSTNLGVSQGNVKDRKYV